MGRSIGIGSFSRSWFAALAAVVALFYAEPAHAQNFMVQPMTMEVAAHPGRSVEVPLGIHNLAGGDIGTVNLRLVELSQGPEGAWRVIEPGSDEDIAGHSSSLAWSSLSHDQVEIAPLEPTEVMVRLSVPPSARGAYFAGVIVESPPIEEAPGVMVRVRFLVPIIIEIDGRPARQQVVLDDVAMTYHDDPGAKPTTKASMSVANRGQTFSRVSGGLSIEREDSNGRWRPVTRVDVVDRAIIPGVELDFGGDLERRLPSGTYRLRADLQVDGRPIAALEKEIAFEGDPNIDTLAYDTALVLTPEMVRMDVVPGATRTTALTIENPGDDPVHVRMAVSTPQSLVGVEMGDLKGSALSAEPWTEMRPAEFTLRPGGRQNVRVMSRVPREGVQHANYYADLVLEGAYEDGQSAGETRSTVQLFNAGLEARIDGEVEQLLVSEGDGPSRYIVQMRFANTGTVHLEPTAYVALLNPQGRQVNQVELTAEEGALLPLARRRYSGEMDLSEVEPGYYALRSRTHLTDGNALTGQQVLLVESGTDGAGTSVTVVDPEAHDIPEGLDEPGDQPRTAGEAPAGASADQDDRPRS